MFSSTIHAISDQFQTHPIKAPHFTPSDKYPSKFKHEVKCIEAISSYGKALAELQDSLNVFEPTRQFALVLIDQINPLKTLFNSLNSKAMLLSETKQNLKQHGHALQQLHILACQLLIGDIDQSSIAENAQNAESYYKEAKDLEEMIDLKKVFDGLNRGAFVSGFKETLQKILKAHHLYQMALSNGKKFAINDVQRTATHYYYFQEFAIKLDKGGFFNNYIIRVIFPSVAKVTLTYKDWRMEPLMDFFIHFPEDLKMEMKDTMLSFIFKYMTLDPDSKNAHLILKMAIGIVSSKKFSLGNKESEEGEVDYQEQKIERLKGLIEDVNKDLNLIEVSKIPKGLKVNTLITDHSLVKLLLYAHLNEMVLDELVHSQIDRWMAALRFKSLKSVIGETPKKEAQVAYVCRRDYKKLGLLIEPPLKEIPYSSTDIHIRYINATAASLRSELSMSKIYGDEDYLVTEKTMISHFLESVDEKFLNALRQLMNQQALESILESTLESLWDGYFEKGKLTKEGARALLFAAGYLGSNAKIS